MHKEKVMHQIASDPAYSAVFTLTIQKYLQRSQKRFKDNPCFDLLKAQQYCFDYLVEECAAMCLWPSTGCHYELYNNPHNAAMEQTRRLFVGPNYPQLIHPVTLAFNHRPNLKPQTFESGSTTIQL